ncbi:TPA: hypothetical protein KOR75_001067 [Clostridioides difficile]|nr:hypothetical protein [Clostridioides difficile]
MRKYKDIVMFVLVCFSLIWFTACSNKEEEHNTGFVFDNTNKELSLELDDSTCSLKLGDKLGSNVTSMLENFYGNQSAYKNDTNSKLGTQESLNKFMSENYKYVSGEVDAAEDELNAYIEGYSYNTNVRILGGETSNGYFTVTVYNPTDTPVSIEDGIIKSIWLLNCNDLTFEYDGINSFSTYDEVKDLLSSYTEITEPFYTDKEFNKIDDKENVSIYLNDNKVVGIKIAY